MTSSTQGRPILSSGEVTRPLLTEAEVRQQKRDREQQRIAEANARHAQSMFDTITGRK